MTAAAAGYWEQKSENGRWMTCGLRSLSKLISSPLQSEQEQKTQHPNRTNEQTIRPFVHQSRLSRVEEENGKGEKLVQLADHEVEWH